MVRTLMMILIIIMKMIMMTVVDGHACVKNMTPNAPKMIPKWTKNEPPRKPNGPQNGLGFFLEFEDGHKRPWSVKEND